MKQEYHFHKDCKYYPQCTEETITEGKHTFVRFTCPRINRTQKYYPGDIHTIKFSCGLFEPYQDNLLNMISEKEEGIK